MLSCACILQPLHDLLKSAPTGNTPLTWPEAATTAFHQIKDALMEASLLVHPVPGAPTCILTDASSTAMGAILQQRIGDVWFSIAYFSRRLSPTQMKYSTFDRKLLAIYLAITHFQHFVEGREFYVDGSQASHLCPPNWPSTSSGLHRPVYDRHLPSAIRHPPSAGLCQCSCQYTVSPGH